jgi:hypothetical protein
MATQAQIKANRQNAQKSTGPKTAGGKAAVSKNAVKHGLFTDAVVTGETEAEYEAFRGELLAELAPRGVMELLLAERVVSLWWRLIRAERMQNQAIEDMIVLFVTNNTSRSCREYHIRDHGIQPDDPEFDLDDLPLGRIGNKDFANCRLLDRMLLYERRIESSLNRAMKELKSFQTIRRIEWQQAKKQQSAPNQAIPKAVGPSTSLRTGFEAATRFASAENHADLKKQTQFAMDNIAASLYPKDDYDDNTDGETGENKANLSLMERSRSRLAPRDALGVEKEKSASAAAG